MPARPAQAVQPDLFAAHPGARPNTPRPGVTGAGAPRPAARAATAPAAQANPRAACGTRPSTWSAVRRTRSLKTEAVVFDCDGTLLDSMGAWHDLEADLAWMAGIELTPQQESMLNANTLEQTVAYFHNTYGVGRSVSHLLKEARGILLESYCTTVRPRPGAYELVEHLRSSGLALAVASSSSRVLLKAGLARAGLLDVFDLVASAEDEGTSKRETTFYRSVICRMGANPARTWGIDDSAYALAAMRASGFSTLGIYDTDQAGTMQQLKASADVAIRSFAELNYHLLLKGFDHEQHRA